MGVHRGRHDTRSRQLSEQDWGTPLVRAPQADEALAKAKVAFPPRALGLGAPGAKPAPNPALPRPDTPAAPAAPLPSSPVDREGMYRGLLWVAFAVDECRRVCTRLSSRLAKLESRIDLVENDPGRTVAPEPAPTPAPVVAPEPDDRGRMDALETRVRQLEHVPLSLANLQRAVDDLGKAEPTEAAAPTPAAGDDAGELELEGVYQELDRVAEFVAARVESLERALLQAATNPGANGHDDAEHRLRELEARMERFERLYTAMQAGLELATA